MNDFTAWALFTAAMGAFMGSHVIPSRPAVRSRLISLLGKRVYIVLYSSLSLAVLGFLIRAAADAPYVEVWPFEEWQRLVPAMVVPLAFALGLLGLATPNPLSLSPSRAAFDPARPGIVAITRHPVLVALALWSLAHMVPNGDLAHLILFGTFLVFSLAGMWAVDKRARRRLGDAVWADLASRYRWLQWPRGLSWLTPRLVLLALGGVALALLAAMLHEALIGVPALPL